MTIPACASPKRMMNPHCLRLLLIMLAVLIPPAPLAACNIPVFRYALERWRSTHDEERYQILVFHHGQLAGEDAEALAALRAACEGRHALANAEVQTVDLAGPVEESLRKPWQMQSEAKLPWMVLRYPESEGQRKTIWAGPLRKDRVQGLLDSPARRDIAGRLMQGEAVVWVLLESGDEQRDQAAARTLETELRRLEKSLRLPDPAGDNSVQLLSRLPLRLAFSIRRVRRTDPAEAVLIDMLRHSDDDLAESVEPMVFPVFGRGRALDGIIGKGINADTIEDAARFLCGACSCLVKRLNPGVDLLIAAGWESIIEDGGAAETSPPAKGQRVPIPTPKQRPESASEEPRFAAAPAQWPLVAGIGALVALGAVLLGWRTWTRSNGSNGT
jgi:hypothetical protein